MKKQVTAGGCTESRCRSAFRALSPALALALLWLGSPGCGSEGEAESRQEEALREVPVNVRAMVLERTTLREYLSISGVLRPVRATDVSAEESGVVEAVLKDKGSFVEKGEAIVRLRRELLEAEMRAAQATRSLREFDEERTRRLFEAKQVSRQEMLRVEAELEEAKARADVARVRWERAAIKAPYAGVVADRYVEVGQRVQTGMRVARMVDPRHLKLEASVSEREVSWIGPGSRARVEVETLEEPRPGRVQWVSFEANPSNGKFQVEVRVDNEDLRLRPGVVARARVLKHVHEKVIVLPRDAIVLLPEGPIVYVIQGERARARPVELGADEGLMTIVTEGLQEGERVVVRGQRDLFDGSLVRVREKATSPDGSMPGDPAEIRAAETPEATRRTPAAEVPLENPPSPGPAGAPSSVGEP